MKDIKSKRILFLYFCLILQIINDVISCKLITTIELNCGHFDKISPPSFRGICWDKLLQKIGDKITSFQDAFYGLHKTGSFWAKYFHYQKQLCNQ